MIVLGACITAVPSNKLFSSLLALFLSLFPDHNLYVIGFFPSTFTFRSIFFISESIFFFMLVSHAWGEPNMARVDFSIPNLTEIVGRRDVFLNNFFSSDIWINQAKAMIVRRDKVFHDTSSCRIKYNKTNFFPAKTKKTSMLWSLNRFCLNIFSQTIRHPTPDTLEYLIKRMHFAISKNAEPWAQVSIANRWRLQS